jgi:phage-related protein
MANFPSIEPSFSVTKKSKPVVKVVSFADGFEHRLGFGLPNNQDPKIFNLKWENITEEESDTIEYFLEERARDKASFTYSPPKESFTKTGTYSQSSTTITITITDHRLFAGDSLSIDFTSGSSADGTYVVSSVTNANVFVVTAASGATTSGNVSITKTASYKFTCPEWSKVINVPNLATITATFVQKFEP